LLSVYALLRAHGGGLRLGHGEQGGTSVQVYLPLGKPLEPSSAAASDGGSVRYAQRLQEQPVRV
jgi:hypothetical protein